MSELMGLRVTVVGAGIGGLAVARALALRGAHVRVVEQAPEITEVGAGLQISPNGMCVLRALGLEEPLIARGAVRAEGVRLIDYRGREVVRLDLPADPAQTYLFAHRADLIAVLEEGAREAGVEIELGAQLSWVADARGQDPAELHCAGGAQGHADLIVGADGIHSQVRPVLNGPEEPFFTGQVAWRATVPNDLGLPPVARVHMGPGRHVVSYPIRGGAMVNLVAVQERRGWAQEGWNLRDDPANLRRAYADFCPDLRRLLERVEEVYLWGLFRHQVAESWHGRALVLLGDAAHPTLPFMAQGAVMALEDAWVLADALAGADSVSEGLSAYQARRRARVERVINTATDNAWKYHLKFPPLRLAAHSVMRLTGRLAPQKLVAQFDWLYGHDVTQPGG